MTPLLAGLNQELESLVGEARRSLVEVAPSDRGSGAGVVLYLIPLHMGNSASLRPGQWVVSLGHPWGVKGAAVGGVITSLDERPGFLGPGPPLLELGLPLRPGHSGGPVLDVAGQLVGINTMIAGPERSFAIPVNAVKRLLKQVLA